MTQLGVAAIGVCFTAPLQAGASDALPCANPTSTWTATIGSLQSVVSARDIAIDNQGNTLVAGWFYLEVDFDPSDATDERISNGLQDAFVTKTYADGSYAWTYTVGGADIDNASSVAVTSRGEVIVGGGFRGTIDFDPTQEVDEHTAVGQSNAFLTKFGVDGAYLSTLTFGAGGGASAGASDIAVDRNDDTVIVGHCDGMADFDPGPGVDWRACWSDIFVTKLVLRRTVFDGFRGWHGPTCLPVL